MYILGISAYYHDSAACLVKDGVVVCAAQEERFTRKKQDPGFPSNAIRYCLDEYGLEANDLDYVAFYEKPILKLERLLETYFRYAPRGIKSFVLALPEWAKRKLWIGDLIQQDLGYDGSILYPEHHMSHAASAFYPSPFQKAAILTVDGVGEWTTTSWGVGSGSGIDLKAEIKFPHSLGMLYAAFTYYTGFKVNSGEYKVMGLAPYGEPKYVDRIYKHLIDVKADGSFKLNMDYFNYCSGLTMTGDKFHKLFGGPPRRPESVLTQKQMDLARSVQVVTEETIMKIARHIHQETGEKYLCLAGGVALNCVSNGLLLKDGPFENIWIQPAAGDAGGALGAALSVWYQYLENERTADDKNDFQQGSYLGPSFSNREIELYLQKNDVKYRFVTDEDIPGEVADLVVSENVVGWFQGRMEFGPRALGHRSIIGDARSSKMQEIMNLKIKFRESFRPFAPSVMEDRVGEIFDTEGASPYMLLVTNVLEDKLTPMDDAKIAADLDTIKDKLKKEIAELKAQGRDPEAKKIESLIDNRDYLRFRAIINQSRSVVPAITHVNYSARLQTVNEKDNALYYRMIKSVYEKTGIPVIINTSFNIRGEPIVCSPTDAFMTFLHTDMDYLIMGNYLVAKSDFDVDLEERRRYLNKYELD